MSARLHDDGVEVDAHAGRSAAARIGGARGRGRARRGGRRLVVVLGRAQGLGEAERDVALAGVLLDQARDLLPERRYRERPVHDEQHGPGVGLRARGRAAQEAREQGRREPEAERRLRRLGRERGAQGRTRRREPLAQTLAVLARDGVLGPVRAYGDEAQERVEIESRERARVVAHAHVALRERRLRREWHEQHGGGQQHGEPGAPGIKPDQRRRRDDEARAPPARAARPAPAARANGA